MCYDVPEFALVFDDRFIVMHVTFSPNLVGVRLCHDVFGSMASKRTRSKDIDGSATRVEIEQGFVSLPIYEDTKLILDKDIKMKWQEVNDAFEGTFWEDLKHHQVYMNIHKLGLYQIACKYLVFPCKNMIH